MFDNFGLGEFMTIALFALLFFGPERLPQIGAKLGQWLAKLTQQSKLFMYQWREEALAIHGAVEEVKGIRDEIMAARSEIAGTMRSAQGDITESLDDVKGALDGSQVTFEKMAQQATAEERAKQTTQAPRTGGGDDEAIERTQGILANMQARLGDTPLESQPIQVTPPQDDEQTILPPGALHPAKDGAEDRLEKAPEQAQAGIQDEETEAAQDQPAKPGAHEQTQQIVAAMQLKLAGESVERPESGEHDPGEEPVAEQVQSADQTQPDAKQPYPVLGTQVVGGQKTAKKQGPTAYDLTPSIIERMQRKLAGEPVDELETLIEGAAPAEDEAEAQWAANYELIQAELGKSEPQDKVERKPTVKQIVESDDRFSQVVPTNGTQVKIEELSGQVSALQGELKSLRRDIELLQATIRVSTALAPKSPVAANAAEKDPV